MSSSSNLQRHRPPCLSSVSPRITFLSQSPAGTSSPSGNAPMTPTDFSPALRPDAEAALSFLMSQRVKQQQYLIDQQLKYQSLSQHPQDPFHPPPPPLSIIPTSGDTAIAAGSSMNLPPGASLPPPSSLSVGSQLPGLVSGKAPPSVLMADTRLWTIHPPPPIGNGISQQYQGSVVAPSLESVNSYDSFKASDAMNMPPSAVRINSRITVPKKKRGRIPHTTGSRLAEMQSVALTDDEDAEEKDSAHVQHSTGHSEEGHSGQEEIRKGPWLPHEDELLKRLIEEHGPKEWSYIAEQIPGRVGKQCRERYFNHLAPDVRKDAWTALEDDAIIHAHHVVGNKWTNIAKMLGNGRSPNSIKNRWHSSLKNRIATSGGEEELIRLAGANKPRGCICGCRLCRCTCAVNCLVQNCSCCAAAHETINTGKAFSSQKKKIPEL